MTSIIKIISTFRRSSYWALHLQTFSFLLKSIQALFRDHLPRKCLQMQLPVEIHLKTLYEQRNDMHIA